jgi:hypothetical protein
MDRRQLRAVVAFATQPAASDRLRTSLLSKKNLKWIGKRQSSANLGLAVCDDEQSCHGGVVCWAKVDKFGPDWHRLLGHFCVRLLGAVRSPQIIEFVIHQLRPPPRQAADRLGPAGRPSWPRRARVFARPARVSLTRVASPFTPRN